MTSITLHLPYPVSVNRIWKVAGKRVYRSKEYTDWIKLAGVEWILQKSKLPVRNISGHYTLTIQAQRPNDKRRRDLGNLEKVISDFLQDIEVINDDSLCDRYEVEWRSDLPAPIVVTVTKK